MGKFGARVQSVPRYPPGLTRDERPSLFTVERFAAASPGSVPLVFGTCCVDCSYFADVFALLWTPDSLGFCLYRLRALLPQPYLFVEDRSFLYVSGSLQTGHAVPIPTLTSSAESDTSQGLEGICSFCGLSPRENFEGVCGPFLDH